MGRTLVSAAMELDFALLGFGATNFILYRQSQVKMRRTRVPAPTAGDYCSRFRSTATSAAIPVCSAGSTSGAYRGE